MTLAEVVQRYLAIAGDYGRLVALADLGLDYSAIEKAFSLFDEDYHISRYFHLVAGDGVPYTINGFRHTHVMIDREIESLF